jgi:hypothetical protein
VLAADPAEPETRSLDPLPPPAGDRPGEGTTRALTALPARRFERRRRPLPLGLLLLAALTLSAAVAALLDVTGALGVPLRWFLVYAVGLGALAVVVSPWIGRARGPVALTAGLAAALALAFLVDVPLRGGIGERTVQPGSAAELAREYRLGVGRLVVDLRSVATDGVPRRVEAGVGVGSLVVILPPALDAVVEGRASVGRVEVFGHEDGGVDAYASALSRAGETAVAEARLVLDLEVGVGKVETYVVPTPPAGGTL